MRQWWYWTILFLTIGRMAAALPDQPLPLPNAPAWVIPSGSTTVEIDSEANAATIHFAGWNGATVRFRFVPSLDLSMYRYLTFSLQVTNLTGNVTGETPLTLQFYDAAWTAGASQAFVIPAENALGESVYVGTTATVSIPLPEFATEAFSPNKVTDFIVTLTGSGPISAEVVLTNPTATGGPPDTAVLLPAVVPPTQDAVRVITERVLMVTLDGALNTLFADDPALWTITSGDDPQYAGGESPVAVDRFSYTLDADDHDQNGQTLADVVLRHELYLQLPHPLALDASYSIVVQPLLGIPQALSPGSGYALTPLSATTYEVNAAAGEGPAVVYYYLTPEAYWSYALSTEGSWTIEVPTFAPWSVTMGQDADGAARAIKINQFGYAGASQVRYAYVGDWLGSGGPLLLSGLLRYDVHHATTHAVVASGMAVDHGWDADSGEWVEAIDLGPLASGSYYLEVDDVGRSLPFRIGGTSFEAFYHAARGLYHQRCSTALLPDYTPWPRATCHESTLFSDDSLKDWGKFFSSATPKDSPITIVGGWHDAGDFDRRPLHLATVEHLLILTELFPDRFGDGLLNIPESGNGLSDLLDEALYGLALWQQLQQDDGGVGAGTESYAHPSGVTAPNDPLPYWTYAANRWTSYQFAASAAHAARLLSDGAPFGGDADKGALLLNAALAAWQWAEAQTEWGITSPVPNSDASKESAIHRARMSAAGQLFAATGVPTYQTAFAQEWVIVKGPTNWDSVTSLWGMLVASGPAVDAMLQADVHKRLASLSAQFMGYMSSHAYRNALKPEYPLDWGNGTLALKFLLPAMLQYHFAPDPAIIDAVALNVDFHLGAHPLARSWMSGLGHFIASPLHLDSLYDGEEQPIAGIPVNGPFPNSYSPSCMPATYWKCLVYNHFDPAATADPATSPTPRMRHYSPWVNMAPMNEFTVWGDMAYTVFAYGFLYAVSDESPVDLSLLTASDFPRNAGVLMASPTVQEEEDGEDEADDGVEKPVVMDPAPSPPAGPSTVGPSTDGASGEGNDQGSQATGVSDLPATGGCALRR
ncbi:MAG: glycoside hydrolase family 9 protein [Deltaproteobacteria bacterium]|nr:glycoside hydrolase family 9 protein [Deltaproteobacteria bacterium]